MKNNCYARILEIQPINFILKSKYEKEQILDSYSQFLKACDFDFQIIIKTKKENVNSHINYIYENKTSNKKLQQEYCNYIKRLASSKYIFLKRFYLIYSIKTNNFETLNKVEKELQQRYSLIKEYFELCGNYVSDFSTYTDDQLCNFISTFINERENLYEFY